jgi:hypothetical protein
VGRTFDGFDDDLKRWIERQRMFFIATAPGGDEGHVNVSPKGRDTLRLVDDRTLAYLDLTGSGVETIAHVRENGRITVMFCAFGGPPRIVRVHGRGEVIEPDAARWDEWRGLFPEVKGERAVIVIRALRISDSCGYGVPLMEYAGERNQMDAWADRKGADGLAGYRREHNVSLDGLPGLRSLEEA